MTYRLPMSLPPGTILQLMHLKRRLTRIANDKRFFLDIGSGSGILSNFLLQHGFQGVGIDLGEEACFRNRKLNDCYIVNKKYNVIKGDFLEHTFENNFDFIISSCVLEHLDDDSVNQFLTKLYYLMTDESVTALLLPSNPNAWGIEDEVAGHFRRYNKQAIKSVFSESKLELTSFSYLTFPISNILLPISNALIKKQESDKKMLSLKDKTIDSGARNVVGKTSFPEFIKSVVNMKTLLPFDWCQRLSHKNPRSLMCYVEAKKQSLQRGPC